MADHYADQHEVSSALIGLDVAGFSGLFEAEVQREGQSALERLTDGLNAGCEAMLARLEPHGFRFGAITGDCVICHAPRGSDGTLNFSSAALDALTRSAAEAFVAASDLFSVRAAGVDDVVVELHVEGPDAIDYTFLGGRGVARLHEALRHSGTVAAASQAAAGPKSAVPRPARSRELAAAKAGRAGLRNAIIVFCRLCDGAAVHRLPVTALRDAVSLLIHATAGIGGMFEKIAQDDKGVTTAMAFAAGADSESQILSRLAAMTGGPLERLGFDPAWASSCGPVYTGAILIAGRGVRTMHGPAVNSAAKRLTTAASPIDTRTIPAAGREAEIGVVAPLVGRHAELSALREAAEEALLGDSRFVIVEGEPGIGKSFLCDHALRELGSDFAVVRAACRPVDAIVPLSLARPLLQQGVAQVAALRQISETEAVEGCIAKHYGAADAQMRRVADAYLNDGAIAAASLDPLGGDQVRSLLEGLVEATFQTLSDQAPVALAVDDIQWADRYSIGLIRRLAQSASRVFGLLGCRTSPVTGHETLLRDDEELPLSVIRLQGLALEEVSALLRYTPGHAAGEEFEHACFDVTAGNPHFAIQYAELAADVGTLGVPRREAIAGPPDAVSLRDAILVRRLDLLSDSELLMLRIAASVPEALSDRDYQAIGSRLGHTIDSTALVRRLASRSLLVHAAADAGGAARSRIAHQTLADTVTRMLPPSVVANLSEEIALYATMMARRGGPPLTRIVRAQLWMNAGRRQRAAVLFGAVGDDAMNVGAFDAAVALYGRAEGLADRRWQTARRRALWSARAATARWGLGDISGAESAVASSFSGIESWLSRRDAAMHSRSTGVRWMAGRALRRTLSPEVSTPIDIANAVRGELAYYKGDLGEILRSNAIGILGGGGTSRNVRGRNHAMLGYMAGMMRMPLLARSIFRRTSRRLAGEADKRPVAFVKASEAVLHLAFGRWDEAEAVLVEARSQALDPFDPHLYEIILTLLALGAHFSGQWGSARDQFAELLEHARSRGNLLHVAWGQYGQAQSCLVGGRIGEADELLAQAEPAVTSLGDRQSQLICLGLRAQILLASGRVGEALAKGEEAAAFARTVAPINFSSLEGYAGAPTVALKAIALLPSGADQERARRLLATGRQPLARFAWAFPIARPRSLLALAATRHGARQVSTIMRSQTAATRLRMPYELCLVREAAASASQTSRSARIATPEA